MMIKSKQRDAQPPLLHVVEGLLLLWRTIYLLTRLMHLLSMNELHYEQAWSFQQLVSIAHPANAAEQVVEEFNPVWAANLEWGSLARGCSRAPGGVYQLCLVDEYFVFKLFLDVDPPILFFGLT